MTYVKTELGKTALRDKSLGLTPKQRSTFIMFDGKRSIQEVLALTQALGVTVDDITHLVTIGLLAPAESSQANPTAVIGSNRPDLGLGADSVMAEPGRLSPAVDGDAAQYAKAYPIAVRLTSNLGLRGFRLNLAVEASSDLEALKNLAPKIKEAVGVAKFRELEDALHR